MTQNRPLAAWSAPLQAHGGRRGDGPLRLGLRLNHAALLRQAGDGQRPDMARLAEATVKAGADSVVLRVDDGSGLITADDVRRIAERARVPLTLEMQPDPARVAWVTSLNPAAVMLLPDPEVDAARMAAVAGSLHEAGVPVLALVAPDIRVIEQVHASGIRGIELDTTFYGEAAEDLRAPRLQQIRHAASHAHGLGLGLQAGHALDYSTLAPIAGLPHIQGITCGRFLITEALFIGIEEAVRHTRRLIDAARRQARRHAMRGAD